MSFRNTATENDTVSHIVKDHVSGFRIWFMDHMTTDRNPGSRIIFKIRKQ